MTRSKFNYELAFERNLGWFTEPEQMALRGKCIAIAGMGGVGGSHLLTLARLGIGAFRIADFDRFDLANFNRQVGATIDTIGRPKIDVLEEMARVINPSVAITRFPEGICSDNLDAFLDGVDLFVDGLDFFAIDIRRRTFARCAELGIPAITAAPIGMGTCVLVFGPKSMSFERYFRLEGCDPPEQYLRFLLGLAPRGLHRRYLVDADRVDLRARRGPSTVAACQLCAGVTAVMAVKILLRRGGVPEAPLHQQYDAYRGRLAVTRLRFGNAGPVQRLKLALGRRMFTQLAERPPSTQVSHLVETPLEEILNAARWAPSGDNRQPWRFELLSADMVAIHLEPPLGDDVYEYRNGEPLLLAGGMLLECLRIAATAQGMNMEWQHEGSDWPHLIVVRFAPAADVRIDPLYSYLGQRSVDRQRYRTRPLLDYERRALEDAIGDELILEWYTRLGQRRQFARLSAQATDIRLRAPETFPTHKRIVDWERKLSPTGIPAGALGLNRPTLWLMRWAMRNWSRTRLLNRLGSTTMAALQMDYAPILASAACFTVRLARPTSAEDHAASLLQAGQRLQRFWLTATRVGLALQPLMATLIFADYGEMKRKFTDDTAVERKAAALAESFRQLLGTGPRDFVFMGRIGEPRSRLPDCRSVRRPLDELISGTAESAPGSMKD